MPLNERLAGQQYCYLTTTGRVSGNAHEIEIWFSILWKRALRGGSFTSIRQLRQAITDFTEAYNETAHPFEWKATEVRPKNLKTKYADLCN